MRKITALYSRCSPLHLSALCTLQVSGSRAWRCRITPCTLPTAPRAMHHARCTLHAARCTLHSARCTVHAARCTLHAARCTLHAAPGAMRVGRGEGTEKVHAQTFFNGTSIFDVAFCSILQMFQMGPIPLLFAINSTL